jgi:hypothetical protein
MALHGLIRLADGMRLPREFDPDSRRKPVFEIQQASETAERTLADCASYFDMKRAPAVFRALSVRPIDFFSRDARRLGAGDDAILETLLVVHRFAGLTKFATALNLEPDRVPQF